MKVNKRFDGPLYVLPPQTQVRALMPIKSPALAVMILDMYAYLRQKTADYGTQ